MPVLPQRTRELRDEKDQKGCSPIEPKDKPLPPNWKPIGQAVDELIDKLRRSSQAASDNE